MTLFSNKFCPYSHRVRIVPAEKGVVADIVEVDLNNKPNTHDLMIRLIKGSAWSRRWPLVALRIQRGIDIFQNDLKKMITSNVVEDLRAYVSSERDRHSFRGTGGAAGARPNIEAINP
ncbi:MAG: sspA [Gammaproteobacteria bacterium]|nr:sspA [Gammaproteobacteria bacterium]